MSPNQIVKNEMQKLGFDAKELNGKIIVSLNRFIWTNEVKEALEQVFENISFRLDKISANEILIELEI